MLFWEYHNLIPADVAQFLAEEKPEQCAGTNRRDVVAVFEFLAWQGHGTYLRWKEVFNTRREVDMVVVKAAIAKVEKRCKRGRIVKS